MAIKEYFLRLFQSYDKDEEIQEIEMKLKIQQQLEVEQRKQEERKQWAKVYPELESNVLSNIYGLVNYQVMTSKFDEKYIVAISLENERYGNIYDIYSKSQGIIQILGTKFRSTISSQKLRFNICEKETDGRVQKFLYIRDVNIKGSEGRGSLAMEALISYAKETKCEWIEGERAVADEETEGHKIRRDNYYKKYNFNFEGKNARILMLRL